jgi:hypothetical protein
MLGSAARFNGTERVSRDREDGSVFSGWIFMPGDFMDWNWSWYAMSNWQGCSLVVHIEHGQTTILENPGFLHQCEMAYQLLLQSRQPPGINIC